MATKIPNPQESKLIRGIDYQITMCQGRIRDQQKIIEKLRKMSGMDGPSGISGIDYSGMPRAGFSHMDFTDALASIAKAEEIIAKEKGSIRMLRKRKKAMLDAADILDDVEKSVFVCRIMNKMTQDAAADAIGISARQLQRIERRIRDAMDIPGM